MGFQKLTKSIVFLGTERSRTSIECLSHLMGAGFDVKAVISLKRKNSLTCFVKEIILTIIYRNRITLNKIANQYKINYLRTSNINSIASIEYIKKYKPSLISVCIFGQILKKSIIEIPRYGTINMHPSLLPKYRGPDPYFWVFKNAEKETGVTIHFIDEGIDTGEIILQKSYSIEEGLDILELRKILSKIGSNLMLEAIREIAENKEERLPQKKCLQISAPTPTKLDLVIDSSRNIKYIYHFIKGVKSMGPLFRICNKEFVVKDVIEYEIYCHNRYPDYVIQKEKFIYYGIDGMIILKIETFKDKFVRYLNKFIKYIC